MWKTLVLAILLVMVVLFVGTSRSDAGDPDQLTTDLSFPLPPVEQTNSPSPPPNAPRPHELFTPYDVGPPEGVWHYEDLTLAEKETADLGRDVSGWKASQDLLVQSMKEQARQAAAARAQHQIGLGDLGDTGVVP